MSEAIHLVVSDEFRDQLDEIRDLLKDLKKTQDSLCGRVEVIESTDIYLRRNGGDSWVFRLSPWARRLILVSLLALASAFGFSTEIRERVETEHPIAEEVQDAKRL